MAASESRVLLILFLGVLIGAMDIAVIAPAFPAIQAYFQIDERSVVWIFTVYVLFNLTSTPILARLSDQFGRKSIFVMSVAIFTLGSLTVALSFKFSVMITGRAIQGFGSGGIFPVASALIGDTFPKQKQGWALGILGAVFGVAFIVGPVISGLLLLFNWHWIFIINLPIAIYVIFEGIRLLPNQRSSVAAHFDWAGMIVLLAILIPLAWGVNRIETTNIVASIASLSVWPFLLSPLPLIPVFVFLELRDLLPIMPLRLLKSRQGLVSQALALGAGVSITGLVLLPALAIYTYGVKATTASFMLLPLVLAASLTAPLIGRLVDLFGARKLLIAGALFMAVGTALIAALVEHIWIFFMAIIFMGLALPAVSGAPLRYIMLSIASANQRSAAQGMTSTMVSIGQLLSSAFLGAQISSMGGGAYGYSSTYLVLALFSLVLLILSVLLKERV